MDLTALRRFDLNLLLVFETLMETRSTTRAALELAKTQPGVSRDLARLRRLLGNPLFVRVRGRLEPTREALMLRPLLKTALESLARGLAHADRFEPARASHVFHIGSSSSLELMLATWMARRFATEAPSVSVRFSAVRASTPPDIELEAGKMDIAVGRFDTCPPHCNSMPLFRDRRVCLMRRGHPLRSRTVTMEQLTRLRFVTTSTMLGIPNDLDMAMHRQNLQREQRQFAFLPSNLALAPYILMQSDCVTTMPRRAAVMLTSYFPLKVVELPQTVPASTYSMVWSRQWETAPAHVWLRARVADALADEASACSGPVDASLG